MGKIKRLPADIYFSKCVAAAHDHTCETCGKVGRIEASHVYSRRHRTIRWDKLNIMSQCHGCHAKWHESPLRAFAWFESEYGTERIELLQEKMNNKVKVPKIEEKEIAKHYREQLKLIEEARSNGAIGYVDFVSYQ